MTLYFDVTPIVDARHGKMTGIPRVVHEVGRRLVADGARCVAWDNWKRNFVAIDFARFVERVASMHAMDPEATLEEPATAPGPELRYL